LAAWVKALTPTHSTARSVSFGANVFFTGKGCAMAALEIHAASKANMLTAARECTRPSRITGEEYFRFFIDQSSINVLVAANHCAVRAKGALRELQWFCAAMVPLKLLEVQTVCLCRQSRTMQNGTYLSRSGVSTRG
jgi:hypothetical protein